MGKVKLLTVLVVLLTGLVGCVALVSQAAQSVEEETTLIGDAKDLELVFKGTGRKCMEWIEKGVYVELDIIEASCKRNPTKLEGYILFDFVGRQKNSGNFPAIEAEIIVTFYRGNERLGKDRVISDLRASTYAGGTRAFGGTAIVKGHPTKAVLEIRMK